MPSTKIFTRLAAPLCDDNNFLRRNKIFNISFLLLCIIYYMLCTKNYVEVQKHVIICTQ